MLGGACVAELWKMRGVSADVLLPLGLSQQSAEENSVRSGQ